jgi:seryl-tRNA synthetase
MRNPAAPNSPQGVGATDEVVERLIRLEEQMRHIVFAVEKLASRDAELDASFRATSDRFTAALAAQAEVFRESLKEVTEKFVSRDDWAFWKTLLTTGILALIAFGWNTMISGLRR